MTSMNARTSKGFTIIETVLFLGVTGLMIAGMFIGIGSSLGVQRYKDSVESFKSLLQQQYADIASVKNGREGVWACTVASGRLSVQKLATGATTGALPGQGRCDIIGKYMTVSGGSIKAYTVLSLKTTTPTGSTDIQKLTSSAYTLGVSTADVLDTSMEWGAKLSWPQGSNPTDARPVGATGDRQIAMLFIRSPDGGGIYTFSSNTVPTDTPTNSQLKAMIVAGTTIPGRAERLLCVDSDGLVLTANRGIFLEARAADSAAVRASVNADFSGAQRC